MCQAILPSIKHTGGLSVEVIDIDGKHLGSGHISLENQPLSDFVEAVMTENPDLPNPGKETYFEIREFLPETCKMKVCLETA
jgi:hypothetical protein